MLQRQRQRRRLWHLLAPMSEIGARYRAGRPAAKERLTEVSEAFMTGVRRALESDVGGAELVADIAAELRPFALEGLGAGALMCDHVQRRPWPEGRCGQLLGAVNGPVATLHAVGAGWALARLGREPAGCTQWPANRLPAPATRSFGDLTDAADDGYGFHEGLFHSYRFASPKRFRSVTPALDRGLGRSLWFVRGGEASAIERAIAGFAHTRQVALWIGVGVAAAFTGGVASDDLRVLGDLAGDHRGALAEGVCLARELRGGLGEGVPDHTEMAVATLGPEAARLKERKQ